MKIGKMIIMHDKVIFSNIESDSGSITATLFYADAVYDRYKRMRSTLYLMSNCLIQLEEHEDR